MISLIYLAADNSVELQGLTDTRTKTRISDASVSVTLLDAANTPVTGQTWPVALAPVTNQPGLYRATLPLELQLVAGKRYTLKALVSAGPGRRRTFTVQLVAQ
jgi:hypothetical protein